MTAVQSLFYIELTPLYHNMKPLKIFQFIIITFYVIMNSGCKKKDEDTSDSAFHPPYYGGKLVDFDGNLYDTIRIGSQTWTKQNLKVTHFNNGAQITYDTNNVDRPSYCNYDNNGANVTEYGRLYNDRVVDSNLTICPTGWHVPTQSDWDTLIAYIGGISVAGRKLKEPGIIHWLNPNDADNSSGFTALPGGSCSFSGFGSLHYGGFFWSSTYQSFPHGYSGMVIFYMFSAYPSIQQDLAHNPFFASIRCIKN
jgi:uncharacterized protein (TIGR02145 family)